MFLLRLNLDLLLTHKTNFRGIFTMSIRAILMPIPCAYNNFLSGLKKKFFLKHFLYSTNKAVRPVY